MADSRLAELAQRHAIDLSYHDVWGAWHEASDETLRALLAAMGIAAAYRDDVEASIAEHESGVWSRVLPPAVVVRVSRLHDGMRAHLDASLYGRDLAWRLTDEEGRSTAGSWDTARLSVTAEATVQGTQMRAVALPLPPVSPGYHKLELLDGTKPVAVTTLIVAPDRCYSPAALADGGRVWGAALQVYGLRSERNWGMGDFSDLARTIEQWAARGASIVGVNPLHALFLHNPPHVSPYSPSTRLFVNAWYLDVEAIPDFHESGAVREHAARPEFITQVKRLRDTELVDYAGVAHVKRPVLELMYAHFSARHLRSDTQRARDFREYCGRHGDALRRYALFEALQEHLHREDPRIGGWQQWPACYREPEDAAVTRFAAQHAERVGFFEYLQWQADLQLARVEERCYELGLGIGLYTDLAISVDRSGAEAWANQALYALTASVGAPPDEFNIPGQDWGLPPLVPERLRDAGFAPLIATLRANMARAGALRIDHVMGLARLFWVPLGMSPVDGAYVRYPFEDLLGIVALESHRHRCVVIGEDLGTVPDELRAALHEAGVLSYRLLIFERDHAGQFRPPADYPHQALVACSTHDLPTLAGYWQGGDIVTRSQLGLYPAEDKRDAQVLARAQERAALLLALERENLLPAGAGINPAAMPAMTPEFSVALHTFAARSRAGILVAQLEDVLCVPEQSNLPGTVDEHPNWRRKVPVTLERLAADERFIRVTDAIRSVRSQTAAPRPRGARRQATVRIPRATYRLQLHSKFRFVDATALVPYLAQLGVSHAYCSPFLRARPGSTHGYDIVDHQAINPEIGTEAELDAFAAALHEHGLGQMMDVVPNHMGVMGGDNAWWLEVLENGQASVYADFFDIDWQPASADLSNRVLLPVLGDHYGAVVDRGELTLEFDAHAGRFSVRYYQHHFPVDPREYPRILERALPGLAPPDFPADALAEMKGLISAFGYLPGRDERAPERIAERSSNKEVHKRRLAQLAAAHPVLAQAVERAVRSFNGVAGDPASFDALHALLEAQAYRLAYWRVASDEINYRRFFDINDLAALRMENEAVFDATHRLVFELLVEGKADALRIDHPDGLYDPADYFRRLQDRYRQLLEARDVAVPADLAKPLYVAIEKIIAPFENMPDSWHVHGTTGYRYANVVNGLFVDGNAETKLTRTYAAFIGDRTPFEEIANRCKRLILRTALASELTVLANQLARIAAANRLTRDYTLNTLRQALAEVIASFPVYRTYVAAEVSAEDRRYIEWAVGRAKRHSRAADGSIFDFIKACLLCEGPAAANPALARAMRAFAMKFQQVTAPVMAKGVEDTSFYIYNRLLSLNDVGGDPASFGCTVNGFHGASMDRAARWPHTMLATSTHDNKRSEDVRSRINVLSEMPAAWRLQLRRWSRMNRSKKRTIEGEGAPTRNDEYLLYQTLLGSFPVEAREPAAVDAYCERIQQYMLKAVREAKVHSSWINSNEAYESAVAQFVRAALASGERNLFLDDLRAAVVPVAWLGMLNSLCMTAIKLTSPGVPDLYQGSELWDFSLVDPDNRRPVDYARRTRMLAELAALPDTHEAVRSLLDTLADGRAKLNLIWRLLALRREREALFERGGYTPLVAEGERAPHVVGYARSHSGAGIVVIAGRLFGVMGVQPGALPSGPAVWGDTQVRIPFLAEGAVLRNVLNGTELRLAAGGLALGHVIVDYPVAVLTFEQSRH